MLIVRPSARCLGSQLQLIPFFLFVAMTVVESLRIIEVKVRPEVLRGTNVDLRCVFDSDGDRIYSVKWYKGSHEFFRYLPEGPVRFQLFPWSNFTIDYDPKEPGRVFLLGVNREAEGRYKCEVSTEAPTFDTDYGEKSMAVHDVNSRGVILTADSGARARSGSRPELLVPGKMARFHCSFSKSRPRATLSWFVDGKQVPNVESRYELSEASDSSEWWSVESDLQVTISELHVAHKGLTVSCTANVSSVYGNTSTLRYPTSLSSVPTDVVSASMASSRHGKESSFPNKGGATGARRPPLMTVACLLLLIASSALS